MSAFWIRLSRNWFRNALAVLQVALAIAAITVVVGEVVPILRAQTGEDEVFYTVRYQTMGGVPFSQLNVFRPEDAAYLRTEAGSVAAATWYSSSFSGAIRVDGQHYLIRGYGRVDLGFADVADMTLVAGNWFAPVDVGGDQPRVALVSEELARTLFGTVDAVGRTINVRSDEEASLFWGFPTTEAAAVLAQPGTDVEIIGVFAPPSDMPYLGFGFAGPLELLLPVSARDLDGPAVEGELLVKPHPGMDQALEEEVRTLLRARFAGRADVPADIDGRPLEINIEQAFSAQSLRESRLQGMMLLGAMGMAALVVSSIAMFTTTLTNLTQRTRFIGLSRALGATRARVVREAVVESALLAGIGGVLGVLAAYPLRQSVLAPLFSALRNEPVGVLDVLIVGLVGVALAMAVGAVAALYPAWTVARMAPAEAWREGRL